MERVPTFGNNSRAFISSSNKLIAAICSLTFCRFAIVVATK